MIWLRDHHGPVLAWYPATRQFHLDKLRALVQRKQLRYLSLQEIERLNQSLSSSNNLAATLTRMQIIIDESFCPLDRLGFNEVPGRQLEINLWDMLMNVDSALLGGTFSVSRLHPETATPRFLVNLP